MRKNEFEMMILFTVIGISLLILELYVKVSYALPNYTELKLPTSNGAYFNNLEFPKDTVADPFILKEKDTYYVYSSGLRIMKSKDFKNWTTVTTRAIALESDYNNYWAPEVYKYQNKYYMFYTGAFVSNVSSQKRDILVAVSDSPEGPFVKKSRLNSSVKSPIDPNVLFDDDGKIYLYTKSEYGNRSTCCNGDGTSIYVEELNDDLLSIKSNISPKKVLTYNVEYGSYNWEKTLVEGSYIFKRNGKYYLMYSTGNYAAGTYAVGYAVSKSPTDGFRRITTNNTSPLLYGEKRQNGVWDSNNHIYSVGHNSILRISDDEMYIVYHSAKYNNNKFAERKLNADFIGIDASGNLYVNGPSKTNQPLPSGSMGLYKLAVGDYTVKVNGKIEKALNDNINYNVLNTSTNIGASPLTPCKTVTTSSIIVNLKLAKSIEDIWIFINNNTSAKNVNVIINNKFIIKNVSLDSTGSNKVQLPKLNELVTSIQLDFSQAVVLSEISLYYNNNNINNNSNNNNSTSKPLSITYTGTFISDGKKVDTKSCTVASGKTNCTIVTPKAMTKSGYTFTGWGTSNCTSGIKENQSLTLSKNLSFYACFIKKQETIDDVTFNVDFKDQNKTLEVKNCTVSKKIGKCKIVTPVEIKKENYLFIGWSKNNNCENIFKALSEIEVSKDETMYACFSKNDEKKYTVVFQNQEEIIATKSCTISDGKDKCLVLAPNNIEKEHYQFGGWAKVPNCINLFNRDGNIELKEDLILYACFTKSRSLDKYYLIGLAIVLIGVGTFLILIKKHNS